MNPSATARSAEPPFGIQNRRTMARHEAVEEPAWGRESAQRTLHTTQVTASSQEQLMPALALLIFESSIRLVPTDPAALRRGGAHPCHAPAPEPDRSPSLL